MKKRARTPRIGDCVRRIAWVATALCVLAAAGAAVAQPTPRRVVYQARLEGLTGELTLVFQIHDVPEPGATPEADRIWGPEIHVVTPDADGNVVVVLGSSVLLDALDPSLPWYLDVTVQQDTASLRLDPRTRITPSFHAATAESVPAGAITAQKLADRSVRSAAIADGSVQASDLALDAIETRHIAVGTLSGAQIAAGSITAADLAANSVGELEIASGQVTTADLANQSVTASRIAERAVTRDKIATNAVTTPKLSIDPVVFSSVSAAPGQIIDQTLGSYQFCGLIQYRTPRTSVGAGPACAVQLDGSQWSLLMSGGINGVTCRAACF